MDCYYGTKGGTLDKTIAVPAFTVPAGVTVGEKVWVSPEIKAPVYCDNNRLSDGEGESVTLWILPEIGVGNSYLQPGILFSGVEHDVGNSPSAIDMGQCVANAQTGSGCSGSTATFQRLIARFKVYVKLKRSPGHKGISALAALPIIRFAGHGYVNGTGKNLKYTLTGVGNIRLVDCSVRLNLSPGSGIIDFGTFNQSEIRQRRISRDFSLSASRAQDAICSDGIKLSAAFFTDEHLSADGSLLRPGNGLQLRLWSQHELVPFQRFTRFTEFTQGQLTAERRYRVELSAVPGEPIQAGPFSAVVLLKVNYH